MTAPHPITWWTRRVDESYQFHFPSDYPTASALAPLLSHSSFDHLIHSLNTACLWDPTYLNLTALPNRVTVCCVLLPVDHCPSARVRAVYQSCHHSVFPLFPAGILASVLSASAAGTGGWCSRPLRSAPRHVPHGYSAGGVKIATAVCGCQLSTPAGGNGSQCGKTPGHLRDLASVLHQTNDSSVDPTPAQGGADEQWT